MASEDLHIPEECERSSSMECEDLTPSMIPVQEDHDISVEQRRTQILKCTCEYGKKFIKSYV